jgi:hypothetical protein
VAERTDSSKTSLTDSGMTGVRSVGYVKRGVRKLLQEVTSASPVANMRIEIAVIRRIDMAATVPGSAWMKKTPVGGSPA